MPDCPALSHSDIHIWHISLDRSVERLTELEQMLSDDERARAGRFRFQRDHDRYVVAHGTLHDILARYLCVPAREIQFEVNAHGKPFMAPDMGGSLTFNLSHSGGLAVLAIARCRDVGVDLERVRPDLETRQIAERFFSPAEFRALQTLPSDAYLDGFYRCWTRKEAYIKARGLGLSLPLDSFEVSLLPGDPPALLNVRGEPSDISNWTLYDLFPAAGYAASLAAEGQGCAVQERQWT